MEVPAMQPRITVITLGVDDLERAVTFYRDGLGLQTDGIVGTEVEAHQDELQQYDTSKGTIRFQADKPLPAELVRKLLQARLAENEQRRKDSP
jgi:catechol 2,3-dioxygenase-like lactoylglutathione lyase family enzyme